MSAPPPLRIRVVVAANGRAIDLELVGELYMPKPERLHDVVDLAARGAPCPVCWARSTMPCGWALPREDRGHACHPARRALASREEIARFARSLGLK